LTDSQNPFIVGLNSKFVPLCFLSHLERVTKLPQKNSKILTCLTQ